MSACCLVVKTRTVSSFNHRTQVSVAFFQNQGRVRPLIQDSGVKLLKVDTTRARSYSAFASIPEKKTWTTGPFGSLS